MDTFCGGGEKSIIYMVLRAKGKNICNQSLFGQAKSISKDVILMIVIFL